MCTRFNIIEPLIHLKGRSRAAVHERAESFNLSTNTLYRWIAAYEKSGMLSALARKQRLDSGQNRLSPDIEEIVKHIIENEYIENQKQRKSIKRLYQEIKKNCLEQKLNPPHINTVSNRINQLSAELKLSRKRSKNEAKHAYSPIKGSFPDADYQLAVIQIDHTKIDIILVDDYYRRPIGRP